MSNGEDAETSADRMRGPGRGEGGGGSWRAAGRGESLTGWLKGLGSEGRMCRWAIMACSRSLSLASCGEVGGEQGLCLVAGRGSRALLLHIPRPSPPCAPALGTPAPSVPCSRKTLAFPCPSGPSHPQSQDWGLQAP